MPGDAPQTTIMCKGDIRLGTGCGTCARCQEQIALGHKPPDRRDTPQTTRRALDRDGFTGARAAPSGQVHLDLWIEGDDAVTDPVQLSMSPGQALDLIQKLAGAAHRALKGAVA